MDEKWQKILSQVTILYQKYGVKSITMDDVSRELGISKKTLYSYVKDKADLVDQVVTNLLAHHKCEMQALNLSEMNAIDILLNISKFVAEQYKNLNPSVTYDLKKYYPEVWDKIVEYRRNHIFEHIRGNMMKGIDEGIYRKDLNVNIISFFYVLKIEEIFNHPESAIFKDYDTSEIFKSLFYYHIRGIANKEGIEYYEKSIKELE